MPESEPEDETRPEAAANGPNVLIVDEREMLFAIPFERDGRQLVLYVTDHDAADEILGPNTREDALAAIGAWSDLDWDEMIDALERIRHANTPTPPIDDL